MRGVFERYWAVLRPLWWASWEYVGRRGGGLGMEGSLRQFVTPLLGRSRSSRGARSGRLGRLVGRLGALLGRSWRALGVFLGRLGVVLEASWAVLGIGELEKAMKQNTSANLQENSRSYSELCYKKSRITEVYELGAI